MRAGLERREGDAITFERSYKDNKLVFSLDELDKSGNSPEHFITLHTPGAYLSEHFIFNAASSPPLSFSSLLASPFIPPLSPTASYCTCHFHASSDVLLHDIVMSFTVYSFFTLLVYPGHLKPIPLLKKKTMHYNN